MKSEPADAVFFLSLFLLFRFSLLVCGDKNAGGNYRQDLLLFTSIALPGCIKAKQQHVLCLIKIPLVLTLQASNATVP